MLAGDGLRPLLQIHPPDFGEAAGDDDCPLDPGVDALLHRLRDHLGTNAQYGQVHRFGKIADVGVDRLAAQPPALGVDAVGVGVVVQHVLSIDDVGRVKGVGGGDAEHGGHGGVEGYDAACLGVRFGLSRRCNPLIRGCRSRPGKQTSTPGRNTLKGPAQGVGVMQLGLTEKIKKKTVGTI